MSFCCSMLPFADGAGWGLQTRKSSNQHSPNIPDVFDKHGDVYGQPLFLQSRAKVADYIADDKRSSRLPLERKCNFLWKVNLRSRSIFGTVLSWVTKWKRKSKSCSNVDSCFHGIRLVDTKVQLVYLEILILLKRWVDARSLNSFSFAME